jgi:hypothetical protein
MSTQKGAFMKQQTFTSIALKTTVIHTVTYFAIGLVSFLLLDYSTKFADPVVANLMRQTDHPLVAAGPAFQVLRGLLFGIVFYALREVIFPQKRGWLTLWLVLVIVGIFSAFGPTPGSIEGMIYTILPVWFHIVGLPEVLIQAGLLAFLTHYWVNHPEKKWLAWLFGTVFVVAVLLSLLGVMSAVGMLPAAS